MSGPSADVLGDAVTRIEEWLLDSGVQLRDGPQHGGVAGWLDARGRPEFVYLEITGYYLTTMAWLAAGAASSGPSAAAALERGRAALAWIASVTTGAAVPPTRLYLFTDQDDWRNRAIFSFDLAMAARGVACFTDAASVAGGSALLRTLGTRLRELCADSVPLRSHSIREGSAAALPDRWSTRPGPHHLKAAAALLRLPPGVLDGRLVRVCRETVAHWEAAMRMESPCGELHPLLYGLEGLLLHHSTATDAALDRVEQTYIRLLALQAGDGSLPPEANVSGRPARADVLAQALRLGALLRAAGRLEGNAWRGRLDALATALLHHVRPDGGVLFSAGSYVANAWCAMFAHQALVLHARARNGALAIGESSKIV